MDVILLSVQYGFGSACFVGTLLAGLERFLGCIGCLIALLRAALAMALRIGLLRVLLRFGFSGVPVSLGGTASAPCVEQLSWPASAFWGCGTGGLEE